MEIDLESVKRRVRKLLAMAGDNRGNENESETAMRMAENLIQAHNIDVAALEESSGKAAQYTWRKVFVSAGRSGKIITQRPSWVGVLAFGVAKFTDCKVWSITDAFKGCGIEYMGDAVDLEYATWLFEMLRDSCYSQADAVISTFRDSFRRGFASRVQRRLKQMREERDAVMQESSGRALVVVNTKLALRDAQFGVQKVVTRNNGVRSSVGFAAGRAAGDRANFSRPIGASNSQARLI